jgi:hypothetical protein
LPTVTITDQIPRHAGSGHLIDLRELDGARTVIAASLVPVSLSNVYRERGRHWLHTFVREIGLLNAANAGVSWWAYTTTAKNLLSSPLGFRLFEALAIIEIIKETSFDNLYVVGATAGQRSMIRLGVTASKKAIDFREYGGRAEFSRAEIWLRLIWQVVCLIYARIRWHGKWLAPAADIFALTYVDKNVNENTDSFFGKLHYLLGERIPPVRLGYLAFVQSPYHTVVPRLLSFATRRYQPLLFHASFADLLWALRQAISASRPPIAEAVGVQIAPGTSEVICEALRWDVAKGGYLHNLLVYQSLRRFAQKHKPRRFIYPFENKSLEKLLLLALREMQPACRIIGYQHTSITPRHTTFVLTEAEMAATPMPDLIVTIGEVTRRYLKHCGNFPPEILAAGCALRQAHPDVAIAATPASSSTRILLALSSSRFELRAAIEFMKSVVSARASMEIGIRPHPEFPLSLLPPTLRKWIDNHALDFSETPLIENLQWCTATAYASSTVALECLMLGKPVINLDLGEIVVPDPVIDPPPLWQRAANTTEFLAALDSNGATPPEERAARLHHTRVYMQSYFSPVTDVAINTFLA